MSNWTITKYNHVTMSQYVPIDNMQGLSYLSISKNKRLFFLLYIYILERVKVSLIVDFSLVALDEIIFKNHMWVFSLQNTIWESHQMLVHTHTQCPPGHRLHCAGDVGRAKSFGVFSSIVATGGQFHCQAWGLSVLVQALQAHDTLQLRFPVPRYFPLPQPGC